MKHIIEMRTQDKYWWTPTAMWREVINAWMLIFWREKSRTPDRDIFKTFWICTFDKKKTAEYKEGAENNQFPKLRHERWKSFLEVSFLQLRWPQAMQALIWGEQSGKIPLDGDNSRFGQRRCLLLSYTAEASGSQTWDQIFGGWKGMGLKRGGGAMGSESRVAVDREGKHPIVEVPS